MVYKERLLTMEQTVVRQLNTTTRVFSYSFVVEPRSSVEVWAASEAWKGKRFFFSDPQSNLTFIGLDVCRELRSRSASPYEDVKSWADITVHHATEEKLEHIHCGPIVFGSAAFHPERHRDFRWKPFGSGYFTMPTWLFTWQEDVCVLTVNIEQTNKQTLPEAILQVWEIVVSLGLTMSDEQVPTPRIVHETTLGEEAWEERIARIHAAIESGQVEKVVLSRTMDLRFDCEISSEQWIRHFIQKEPGSYTFCQERGESFFVGATPERLVRVEEGNLRTMALAGSMPRGLTEEEDEAYGSFLLNDKKNRYEHELVVQDIVQELDSVCKFVAVKDRVRLLKARSIQHLYTPIYARLHQDSHILDVIRKLHPTPALGGKPRTAAQSLILELEEHDRGMYGAPLGWFDTAGNGDFVVAIRSGIGYRKRMRLYSGCGVVRSSDAHAEYEETKTKFKTMLNAIKEEKK
ncbi:MAG: isochorismate synthase [Bacilli bacterium]